MRTTLRRLVGGVIVSAIAATTLGVASASPASAAEACSTRVSVQNKSGSANLQYGAYASVWANTSATCPSSTFIDIPLGGTTYLQKSVDGGATWVNVKSNGSSYAAYYGSGLIGRTAWFRTYFVGGTDSSGRTYPTAISGAIRVGVYRKVTESHRSVRGGLYVAFAVKPAASMRGLIAKFQVWRGGRWVIYKRVRANRRGVVKATFRTSRYPGTAYRMILPPKRGYIRSYFKFKAYHY